MALPSSLTSFIGRKREIALVKQALARTRLLTLTGAGGSGKSRLALQVAVQQSAGRSFKDGVCWVELAALSNPDLVAQTIAGALGLRSVKTESVREVLTTHLREKQLLLVLDNCEHLIDASAKLSVELLTRCPKLKILTTSWESLGIGAEQVFPVPALSLPFDEHSLPLEAMRQSDAVQLFLVRARAVKPEFSLTTKNAPAVAQVCRQLDGLPLAIELAAKRIRVMSVEQIAARLEDRLQLLTTSRRTVPSRHQTLRATLDWSYELLTAQEQLLFQRLAVFVGGWTLEAAEAVCASGEIEAHEVLDLLTRLVDKSLVSEQEWFGAARYSFLETIRSYALELFGQAKEASEIQDRHLDLFIQLGTQADSQSFGMDLAAWVERNCIENENFRAALRYSLDKPERERGLRLAGALLRFWTMQSYWSEGVDWLRRALAMGNSMSAPRWGYAILSASYLQRDGGDLTQAITFGEKSLELLRQLDDKLRLANALGALGTALHYSGDSGRALPLFEESLALFRMLDNDAGVAESLRMIAVCKQELGEVNASLVPVEQSLALARELHDEDGIQRSLAILAGTYRLQGDLTRATLTYNEAMEIRIRMGYTFMYPWAFEFYAALATTQHQAERAARLWGAAHALREATGWARPPSAHYFADSERDTRRQLEPRTYTRLFAEGGDMPVEEAVAYAMTAPIPVPGRSNACAPPNTNAPSDRYGGLTSREREVAALLAQGKSNREIAALLVVSERTAANHVGSILSKLGFHSRTQVALWAQDKGMLRE